MAVGESMVMGEVELCVHNAWADPASRVLLERLFRLFA